MPYRRARWMVGDGSSDAWRQTMTQTMRRRPARLALTAAGFALAAGAAGAQTADVTFSRDVAPILQRSCEGCHRPGEMGPMSLTSYEEVRPWARAIRGKVVERSMPPWHLDKTVGIQGLRERHLAERRRDRHRRAVGRRRRPAGQPDRPASAHRLARAGRVAPRRPLRPRAGPRGQLRSVDPDRRGAGPVVAADPRDRAHRGPLGDGHRGAAVGAAHHPPLGRLPAAGGAARRSRGGGGRPRAAAAT